MSQPPEAPRTAPEAILHLLAARGPDKSVAPEEAARLLAGADWRRRLTEIRQAAVHLARTGQIAILRHNKPVDPNGFKGVYRLSLPRPSAPPDPILSASLSSPGLVTTGDASR